MARMRPVLTRLAVGWLFFVPIWMTWGAATYGGLYRWLCEWQLSSVGEYDVFQSFILPTLLLMTPAAVFLRFQLAAKPVAPPKPVDPAIAERVAIRALSVVGLGGAVICAGALLWALQSPGSAGPSADVDLATLGAAAPPLGRVTLIGTIDADHVARKTVDAKGIGGRYLYAAMTIPAAAHGPARIFVEESADDSFSQPLPTDTGNRFRGVLVEGGLPGTALRQFARLGVKIADPYYLLLTGPEGARGGAYTVAFLAGFVALIGLLPLGGFYLSRAYRRRSVSR